MTDFKFDKNVLRKIEKDVERKLAPEVKRRQVDPLRDDLIRLASNPPADQAETRRRVLSAYAKHGLTPGRDVQKLINAVHAGEQLPNFEVGPTP